ncbi:hypothetical protein NM688_g3916 [Phlebia brevispora]|uniref:Uncharacterized protein n=1 Tax=Phlebia brevispora TaxID=194682 RepID=A0ACC1T440_9APHY|nr:hypothetical protein NM688_g3916 [Phlebia brevispora]
MVVICNSTPFTKSSIADATTGTPTLLPSLQILPQYDRLHRSNVYSPIPGVLPPVTPLDPVLTKETSASPVDDQSSLASVELTLSTMTLQTCQRSNEQCANRPPQMAEILSYPSPNGVWVGAGRCVPPPSAATMPPHSACTAPLQSPASTLHASCTPPPPPDTTASPHCALVATSALAGAQSPGHTASAMPPALRDWVPKGKSDKLYVIVKGFAIGIVSDWGICFALVAFCLGNSYKGYRMPQEA